MRMRRTFLARKPPDNLFSHQRRILQMRRFSLVFAIVIGVTGYVSLGSLLGTAFGALTAVVFVFAGLLDRDWLLYILPGLAIVWIAHADNIRRLLDGTERKIDWARLRGRGSGTPTEGQDPGR